MTGGTDPEAPAWLEDVERARWLGALVAGDEAVEGDLAVPVRVVATTAADVPAPSRPRVEHLLDGTWALAGTRPAAEFSIDRWAGTAPTGPDAPRPVDWHRPDTDRTDWLPATVPGTVQGALVAAGALPDPLTGSAVHDELVASGEPADWPWHFRRTDVEQRQWWYARRFRLPDELHGRRVRLSFDGVDHEATVLLDGLPLRHHAGGYGGPDVDVTSVLHPGREHELVVRVCPPPRDWHGTFKASPGWGWHYGHLITTGIWRSVRLVEVPDVEPVHLFVWTTAVDVEDGTPVARLRVEVDVRCHAGPRAGVPLEVVVRRPDGRELVRRTRVDLPAGLDRLGVDVDLPGPDLWWPHGYGDQPLHEVAVVVDGVRVATDVGVRTVRWDALPGRPADGTEYRWRIVVNDRRLFLRGANWCWTDPLTREGPARDAHLLDLVVRAGLQLLRCWGGGIVERDEFYAECDRLGLLVWQEFPLCFGVPDASRTDLRVLDDQVPRVVRRLRNHPCLVLWAGGNENPVPVGGDDALLLVGRRVSRLDPSRPHHRTDPWGGSEHTYRVYHDGEPVDRGNGDLDCAVLSEYGLSSQSSLDSMRRFLPADLLDRWPPEPHGALLQHQAQFSLVDLVKQLRYADHGPVRSWERFVEQSQVAQGEALRFAAERIRAGSGDTTAAWLFYKVGEVFPGASWSVVDFDGVPKLSYHLLAQFSRARCAFAVSDRLEWPAGSTFRARVHVADDTPHDLVGARVEVLLLDARLAPVRRWDVVVDVPADTRREVLDVEDSAVTAGVFGLSVRLLDAAGVLLSDQWYWFNAHPKDDVLREMEARPVDELWNTPLDPWFAAYAADRPAPLLELPRTTLRVHRRPGELVVENTGPVAAVHVVVDGFPHGPGAVLGDNVFGLLPGERRTVVATTPDGGAGLEGATVRAWNADRRRPCGGVEGAA